MSRLPLCRRSILLFVFAWALPSIATAQQPGKPATPAESRPRSVPAVSMGGMAPAGKARPSRAPIDPEQGAAEATLTMDLRKFDFEGTKKHNRMYMPSSAKLGADKPEAVTKEPSYQGKPQYAVVKIGNGTPNRFVIASDEAEGKDARLYLDLNGDGDLTNDGTGAWEKKTEGKDGGAPSLSGTWVFKPGWKQPDGSNKVGEYALNFYWQAGRSMIGYYAASARVGTISIAGKNYDVTLTESDSDGLFSKLFDSSKPIVVGEAMTRPVWLMLDGDQFDVRGTFPFGDLNYLATISDDGSSLKMTPTMKVVRVPRPNVEKVEMLAVGVEAPDFEVLGWKKGQTKLDTTNRFKLSDFRGKKIVVLDMWATWCGPCMKGIPHLSKIAEAVEGQDVAVIAMNTSDDAAPFEAFATGKGAEYKFILARDPAGRDPNGNTISRKLYNVTGIPATFIIGKDGKIAGVVSGYTEGDTNVEQILKGMGVKID